MTQSLRHHFLIAMPALADGNFAGSVTYLCQHDADGALGIVINQPMELDVKSLLAQVIDTSEIRDGSKGLATPVLRGGPVSPQSGFILHSTFAALDVSLDLGHGISFTTAKDMLSAIGRGEGPEHWLVALGYAGWGPGQLESEIAENAWLVCPASLEVLFEVPFSQRVHKAAQSLGIDFNLMSPRQGYA